MAKPTTYTLDQWRHVWICERCGATLQYYEPRMKQEDWRKVHTRWHAEIEGSLEAMGVFGSAEDARNDRA